MKGERQFARFFFGGMAKRHRAIRSKPACPAGPAHAHANALRACLRQRQAFHFYPLPIYKIAQQHSTNY